MRAVSWEVSGGIARTPTMAPPSGLSPCGLVQASLKHGGSVPREQSGSALLSPSFRSHMASLQPFSVGQSSRIWEGT